MQYMQSHYEEYIEIHLLKPADDDKNKALVQCW